jgi:hypothetical protein
VWGIFCRVVVGWDTRKCVSGWSSLTFLSERVEQKIVKFDASVIRHALHHASPTSPIHLHNPKALRTLQSPTCTSMCKQCKSQQRIPPPGSHVVRQGGNT